MLASVWTLSCTGTLIAPNLVVTSGRCLLGPNGAVISARRLHFLAGVSGDKWIAHSTGACIRGLTPEITPHLDMHNDVAVIVLKDPLDLVPMQMADDEALAAGTAVMHAGYGRDRAYRLSLDSTCHVQRRDPGVAITDCDSNFGQIGGPLIVATAQGSLKIAGVVVGGSEHRHTFAATVDVWRHLARSGGCGR